MTFKFPSFLLWFAVAVPLLCGFAPARAQSIEDYTLSVAVPDQSDEARDTALRSALKTVIRRVTGSEVAGNSRAAALLNRAQTQVKQYSYGSNAKDETQLTVVFDQATLDSELRTLGLPVWGAVGTTVSEIALHISGVRSPQAYAKALGALRGLAGVKHVSVSAIGAGVMQVRLQSESSAAKLAAAMVNTRNFRRSDDTDTQELGFSLVN